VAENKAEGTTRKEPSGLGIHNLGRGAEYAHEEGWGINEEERTTASDVAQNVAGGKDYNYGAADFGDEPVNEGDVQPSPDAVEYLTGKKKPERDG
jgi:hypothetical protein